MSPRLLLLQHLNKVHYFMFPHRNHFIDILRNFIRTTYQYTCLSFTSKGKMVAFASVVYTEGLKCGFFFP